MQLSEEDRKRVGDWIHEKCMPMRCFCCGSNKWEAAPFAVIWIGFNTHTTRFHYAEGTPVVYAACRTCGHLVPFSAMMIGLNPDAPAPGSPDGPPDAK